MKRLCKALFEKGKLSKLLLGMGLFALSTVTFAQNAEVFGVIRDASNDELLPGATVTLQGTSNGTITNLDGLYRLSNLTPGSYTLLFSYVGFLTETVEIVLAEGEKKQVDMLLAFDAISLGEVVVTAQMLGQVKALNQQLNSDALVSVVSSDKIEELPDANAAEAIGRLPGISVTRSGGEASKVTVRGLSPKLTNITVNGIKVAPTSNGVDGSDRSVDLSMISPELLSSIEVYKAPTADMDGDAIGGTVNLGIAKARMKPVAKVRLSGGYNSLVKDLSNYKGSFDLSKRFYNDKLGVLVQGNYENTNRSSQTVSVGWNSDFIEEDRWPVANATIRDDIRTIQRMGGNSTLDYTYNSGFVIGQGFYSERSGETFTNQNKVYHGDQVRHLPKHSKSKQFTYQGVLSGQQRVRALSIDWAVSRSQTTNDNFYDAGLYLLEDNGSSPDGSNYVYSIDELLDTRTYDYNNGYLWQYNWEPQKSDQINTTAALDFKIDYSLGDKFSGFLKFGGKYNIVDRTNGHNHQTVASYYLSPDVVDQAVQNMSPDPLITNTRGVSLTNFYSNASDIPVWNTDYSINPEIDMDYLDNWHVKQKSELYPQLDKAYKNYSLTERVSAAYVMVKLNYEKWITFIPGVRYEYSNNDYNGYYSSVIQNIAGPIESGEVRDTTTNKKYGVLLPSFHLKIKPLDWFDIRLSAVKTLARPDFSMVTPRFWINLNKQDLYKGNPELKHSEAWSYDAMVSFFSNKLGLFSIGGFYKEFDNYFTSVEYDISNQTSVAMGFPNASFRVAEDYQNFDNSNVYGFELDFQTNFSYLSAPFNGVVFSANMTRLWSTTYNPKYLPREEERIGRETVYVYDTIGYLDKTVLPDQVELAGNVSLGYDYKGFSVRVSMIYQAPSLKSLGSQRDNIERFKSYSDSFLRFDASISQKIGKHIMLTANLANITGESERNYRWQSNYLTRENRYGSSFDLGFQYKF